MSGIAKGIGGLITSIVEIFQGILSTILNTIQAAVTTVLELFKGVFNVAEGAVGFIIGNLFIIGTLVALYFGYIMYQQRQGGAPVSKSVTGKTK